MRAEGKMGCVGDVSPSRLGAGSPGGAQEERALLARGRSDFGVEEKGTLRLSHSATLHHARPCARSRWTSGTAGSGRVSELAETRNAELGGSAARDI
jgi:hypothetical protein